MSRKTLNASFNSASRGSPKQSLLASSSLPAFRTTKVADGRFSSDKMPSLPRKASQKLIDSSFSQILSTPTLMPLFSLGSISKNPFGDKSASYSQGTAQLMAHYWDEHEKPTKEPEVSQLQANGQRRVKDNHAAVSKLARQKVNPIKKNRLMEDLLKDDVPLQSLLMRDFCFQYDSPEVIQLQKLQGRNWAITEGILKSVQAFLRQFKIQSCQVTIQPVLELTEKIRKISLSGGQITPLKPHQFLDLMVDGKIIATGHSSSRLYFYGPQGMERAAKSIQRVYRAWIQKRHLLKLQLINNVAQLVQRTFKRFLRFRETKHLIQKQQNAKIKAYKDRESIFCENYRLNENQRKCKYEIHFGTQYLSSWQRTTTDHLAQLWNTQIVRIFKVVERAVTETRIIYVSPLPFNNEILHYYEKMFTLRGLSRFSELLYFIQPENYKSYPLDLPVTRRLYYCSKSLRKIRRIIKDHYAYIVPSTPCNDYILLSNVLQVPVFGSAPYKMNFLKTKAGVKQFEVSTAVEELPMLPYSVDIYTEAALLTQLTHLISSNPSIRTWVFKIDDEVSSRGLAIFDSYKLIGKQIMTSAVKDPNKLSKESVYNKLKFSIIHNKEERILPLCKDVYKDQREYLQHFLTKGGLIEAGLPKSSKTKKVCYAVCLEPDGRWDLKSLYTRVQFKMLPVGSYHESHQVAGIYPKYVSQIVRGLQSKQLFGNFIIEVFESQSELKGKCHLSGIHCGLNQYSSIQHLRNFLSETANMLYIPILVHPCLKQLRLSTFFHLCRLQNISFDMQREVGNIFLFMDSLESGCLGMVALNQATQADIYGQAEQVVDFLCSKDQNQATTVLPPLFMLLRNAVRTVTRTMSLKLIKAH